jgi:hypothetical protein
MSSPRQGILLVGLLVTAVVGHVVLIGTDVLPGLVKTGEGPGSSNTEWLLYAVVLILGLALFAMVRGGPAIAHEPLSGRTLGALAIGHAAVVLLAGTFVTGWEHFLDDEDSYVLMAQAFMEGRATVESLLPVASIGNRFIVETPTGEIASCYPPMAGLLTLPGAIFGFGHLGWFWVGGALVWHTTRLAEDVFEGSDGLLVSGLLATSPMLIGLGMIQHTSTVAALWIVLGFRVWWAAVRGSGWAAVGLGAVTGALVLTRPVDATVMLIPLAVGLAWMGWKDFRRLALILGLATIGGLPFLVVMLIYNHAVTGEWTRLPYDLLAVQGPVYGFGETFNGPHTLGDGIGYRLGALARFGVWSLGGVLAFVVGFVCLVEHRRDWRVALVFAIAALHLAAYVPAPFSTASTVGPVYRAPFLPLVAVLAGVLPALGGRCWRRRAWALVGLSWMLFVPWQVASLRTQAEQLRAPVDLAAAAASKHGAIVVLGRRDLYTANNRDWFPPPRDPAEPVWFAADVPGIETWLREHYPERALYRLEWRAGDRTLSDPVLTLVVSETPSGVSD